MLKGANKLAIIWIESLFSAQTWTISQREAKGNSWCQSRPIHLLLSEKNNKLSVLLHRRQSRKSETIWFIRNWNRLSEVILYWVSLNKNTDYLSMESSSSSCYFILLFNGPTNVFSGKGDLEFLVQIELFSSLSRCVNL